MARFDLLMSASVLAALAAGVAVAGASGRLRRNRWLSLGTMWGWRSNAAWRAGNRAAAPILCVVAAVVVLVTVTALSTQNRGADTELLVMVGVFIAAIGIAAASIVAGIAAYRADPVEYRWRNALARPGRRAMDPSGRRKADAGRTAAVSEPRYLIRLRWLTPEEGGRTSGPPHLARDTRAEYRGLWVADGGEAWTLIIRAADGSQPEDVYDARVPFASNGAPRLRVGDAVVLTEGYRQVAVGRVLQATPA